MSARRTARCHCGDLELCCEGDPGKVSICHCADCRRRTGGAFSVAVFYPRNAVTVGKSPTAEFTRPSASGNAVTFNFCANCGSNVFWHPHRMPDLVGVAIGAFDDPQFAVPRQSVWSDEMLGWFKLADEITLIDRPVWAGRSTDQ